MLLLGAVIQGTTKGSVGQEEAWHRVAPFLGQGCVDLSSCPVGCGFVQIAWGRKIHLTLLSTIQVLTAGVISSDNWTLGFPASITWVQVKWTDSILVIPLTWVAHWMSEFQRIPFRNGPRMRKSPWYWCGGLHLWFGRERCWLIWRVCCCYFSPPLPGPTMPRQGPCYGVDRGVTEAPGPQV